MNCVYVTPSAQIETEMSNRKLISQNKLFKKQGQSNIVYKRIQSRRMRFMRDIYITMLDIQWRWAMAILIVGFSISNLVFSVIYFLMSYLNGDFDHLDDPTHTPCFVGVKSYWDTLMFSVETQSTIGYGALYPLTECPCTIPVVFLQVTFGFLLETLLLGFIFMKVARPKHRRHTLIFSDVACVCVEDKQLSLHIRVGDIRNSHLVDAHLYGVLVRRHVTAEKCVYPLYQHEVKFTVHGMKNHLFLFYPLTVSHKITPESPLFDLTQEGLGEENFELLVVLEGTIESTGEMVQTKTSFSKKDIKWGSRFEVMEEYDDEKDQWFINFDNFNAVTPVEMPKYSERDLTYTTLPSPEPNSGDSVKQIIL